MAIEKSVILDGSSTSVNQQPIYYETSSNLEHVHTSDCLTDLICNKQYSIDSSKTRMLFSPSSFIESDLFTLLNRDDSMSLEIKVLDEIAKIRNNPNIAATCIMVGSKGNEFEASKQWRGWFYVEAIRGWIESSKVIVTKVIKPYDPEFDVDFEAEDVVIEDKEYDAQAIINALKNSRHKIPSNTITHSHKKTDGTIEESVLSLLLEQLINSRDSIDGLTEKVGNMPKIPGLKSEIGLSLVSEFDETSGKYRVSWKKIDFDNIVNVPEPKLIGEEQF